MARSYDRNELIIDAFRKENREKSLLLKKLVVQSKSKVKWKEKMWKKEMHKHQE